MEGWEPMETIPVKNVSYLVARDPSIAVWGKDNSKLPAVKQKLNYDSLSWSEEEKTSDSSDSNRIKVYLRIKDSTTTQYRYEVDQQSQMLTCYVPESAASTRMLKDDQIARKYTFSRIFRAGSSQNEIFNRVVKPKLINFVNGFSCSILTYGASGSGKTFTIVGTAMEPGLIPRALEYVFRTLPKMSKEPKIKPEPKGIITRLRLSQRLEEKLIRKKMLNASAALPKYSHHVENYRAMQQRLSSEPVANLDCDMRNISVGIWVSFAEIYNEAIHDLLQTDPSQAKQRTKLRLGNCNGRIYIKDLTSVSVSSSLEAYQILQYGLHKLNYASTGINSHSSRSHCIFTVQLVQASDFDEGFTISYFHFCDLAGSERLKKTHNVGDRLKESNNINTSLMVLGRCISAIREAQKQGDQRLVPFRDSKLTQIFKRALSGLEDIAMVVNISSAKDMFEESQHVLNFAAIAKDIVTVQEKRDEKRVERFTAHVQGRSTAYSTARREEEEDRAAELEEMRRIITELYNENLLLKSEAEENELAVRRELVDTFKGMLKDKDEDHKRKVQQMQEKHQKRIDELQKEINTFPIEVIDLDSSNEEMERLVEEKKSQEQEINERRQREEELESEIRTYKGRITQLEELVRIKGQSRLSANKRLSDQDELKSLQYSLSDVLDKFEVYKKENTELKLKMINLDEKAGEQDIIINENFSELRKKTELLDLYERILEENGIVVNSSEETS